MNCDCVIINDVIRGTQSIDYCEIHSGKAVERLVEAAKNANKQCTKHHVLPGRKTCLDIKNWNDHKEHYCHGCRLIDALAPFQKPEAKP